MDNKEINNDVSQQNKQGLPNIANTNIVSKKILIVITLFFVLIVLIFSFHKKHQNKQNSNTSVDDNFTIPASNTPANQTQILSSPPALTPQALVIEQEKIALQQSLLVQKQKELQQRLNAPTVMMYSQNLSSRSVPNKSVNTGDPNTQFMNQVASQQSDMVYATNIGSLHDIITEGTFISAVLETAINSDLPGYIRAIVNRPVYSADGSQVLIPPGSRLIGEYKSGLLLGQSRLFVVWTRVITPTGLSVNIGSPGVDSLGQGGLGANVIDNHFCERFGSSILLSIIGASTSNVGVSDTDQYNASQAYRMAIANSLSQSASQSFQQTGAISPTLIIYQGTPINVFVAHDLNFGAAISQYEAEQTNHW